MLDDILDVLPPKPFSTLRRGANMLLRPETPLLTQLVVTRRCNLTCGYCNEYDDFSPPIPLDTLYERIDHLAKLGNLILTLTGGEPFLHPDLDKVVKRAVDHGMVVTSISNAYPLTKKRIEQMNEAGLTLLQISVDNMEPNEVSQKSWSKIKKRLEGVKKWAKFKVNINAVLGSSPADSTRELVESIRGMGFYQTVGLLHDEQGQIVPGLLGDKLPSFYDEMQGRRNKSVFHRLGEGWETRMIRGESASFRCRAGARYLYVDEFGKVNYCSQRRPEPGIPLLEYGREELHRAYHAPKGCESNCTIACVRRASSLDEWRPQRGLPMHAPEPKVTVQDNKVHLPQAGG
ncbi:MAG: radical SAM protein [Myxococcota bacterium]